MAYLGVGPGEMAMRLSEPLVINDGWIWAYVARRFAEAAVFEYQFTSMHEGTR